MFKQYYHMSYNPFSKQVKDKDIYQTEDLKQVHGRLDHLKNTGGIGLITAEPGVGKTFAIRTWRNKQKSKLMIMSKHNYRVLVQTLIYLVKLQLLALLVLLDDP